MTGTRSAPEDAQKHTIRGLWRARSTVATLLAATAFVVSCNDATAPHAETSEIAYSAASIDGPAALFVVRPDGSSNRQLLSMSDHQRDPSWSPAGRTLAFLRLGDSTGIWLVNADGTAARVVPPGGFFAQPSWSPDGEWIAYTRVTNGRTTIEAVHADGSGRRTIAPDVDSIEPQRVSWSRTGRIAFVRRFGSVLTIWTVNADGSGLVQLTAGPLDSDPRWSPDGSMLAFTTYGPAAGFPQNTTDAAVVKADGTGRRVLTPSKISPSPLVEGWSPDGRWLLVERAGVLEEGVPGCAFYKLPVSGGAPIRVTPIAPGLLCYGASWQ